MMGWNAPFPASLACLNRLCTRSMQERLFTWRLGGNNGRRANKAGPTTLVKP